MSVLEASYGLSPMQQGFLFHHLSGLPAGVDLEQILIRLDEPLDPAAFQAAWSELTAQHPALRTRFRWEDVEEPLQEVLSQAEIPFDLQDLRDLSSEGQAEAVDAYAEAERARGFDLREAPLCRIGILQLADGAWVAVWSFPHILMDGRSFPLMLRELFVRYDALRGGPPAELQVRPPYREWVEWVQARELSASAPFWRERLSGFREPTPLPGTPSEPGAYGNDPPQRAERELRLSREASDALRELAAAHSLSLNNLVQGAWAILLSRYSGNADVVFGATRAGRAGSLPDADERIGLFINTLPVRASVTGEQDLLPWLADLRARERAVREHEHTPLAELQGLCDVPAGTPLFESLIVFDHQQLDSQVRAEGGDFATRHFELRERTNFPLTLYGYAEPELLLKLAFDRPRFDVAAADRMLGHLSTLLAAMAENPARRLADLAMLTDAERQQILVEWNATAADYPADTCLHQLIEAQADRTPDALAVAWEDESLSYRALDERANRLAHRLRGLGVGPDALVGLCVERSLDLVVGVLGIHKAGGAYVPLDPAYPRERIAYMLEDAGVGVIVTQAALAADLPPHDAHVVRIDADPELESAPSLRADSDVAAHHLAYVIYTSGSTGRPKGVMVEHRNVANFFVGMDERIPHEDGGVWLSVTSLSFDISVLELIWTLARGFKVVVQGDEAREARRGPVRADGASALTFGLFYFAADEGERAGNKYELLLEGAKYADANGFSSVWTPERHFHAFGGLYPNPAVAGAAVAAVTENVGIRAGSVVLPLHHPARVAEEWALVDNLSNGRVGISVASGWQPNDFVLRPENFASAKTGLFDQIETVRKLWRGDAVDFPGPDGKDVATRTLPRPIQSELPIWVTSAGSPETFAAAGRIGANVLTHLLGQTVEEVGERIAAYRAAWSEAGHAGRGQVSMMLHTFIGEDAEAVRETVRRPMMNYLASSVGLIKGFAGAWTAYKKRSDGTTDTAVDIGSLSPEDMEDLVAYSFERYYDSSALFGTAEHCMALIERLQEIGVDDIACLIDFGVESTTVLEHLPLLKRLKEMATLAPVASDASAGEDHRLPAQMVRHGVTHLQCTPSMARMITLDPEARGSVKDLQALMVGGEALPLSLARELRSITSARLLNMYGPTETTIWSSTEEIADGAGSVTIGRPIANNQLYVLDADRNPVPVGVAGELYIGGDGVVRGYLDRPELTAERFLPDPFREALHESDAPPRIYRTGDLARWREDGTVEFIGRVDHQVKVRGYRVELGEIEALLNAHAAVREAVVIPREDEEGDQRLVAYLIAQPGEAPASQALRDHLREKLPEFMVPSHFVCLDEFPQTPNRKVDRKALPDPAELATQHPSAHRKPENEVEEAIASIWQDVLRVPEVGREDNFFDLGGHSLLALKTHRQIVAELDASQLKITDLFRFPTVRALAAHLSDEGGGPSLQKSQDRADARRKARGRARTSRAVGRRRRRGSDESDGQ